MLDALRSTLARAIAPKAAPLATRRFDAAAGGRRWDDARPSMGVIGAEVLAAVAPVRSRARYFVANNPWARSAVEALVTAIVGAGMVPASKHPDAGTRKALAAAWSMWSDRADFDGLTDFPGLQAQAVRAMIVDGEAFAHLVATAEGLQVRLIPAEMVDHGFTSELANGGRVVAGVEFDTAGRRVAYHVLPTRPGGDLFATVGTPIRIPASEMVHLFRPIGAGQVRGMSWLAPVLLRLSELDQLEDALLVGVKVAAMHAGFLTDSNGTSAVSTPYDGTQAGGIMDSGLEPGMLKVLPSGFDIKFSTPQQASQSIEFAQLQLRAISAGLGVPEHLVTGDLRGANYSSLRAGLVAFRQRVEAIQFHTIVPQMLRPIRDRAVAFGVLSGAVEAPDFESAPADYLAADWYPPAQPWVDPLKDQQAEALAVAQGFKSRRQVVAAQGFDIEDVDAEIAADHAREAALGLTFGAPAALGADPQQPASEPAPNAG